MYASFYHELKKNSPLSARLVVIEKLEKNKGNVSKTARELKIHRNTVIRARDGTLNDLSRKPKKSPNKLSKVIEDIIVKAAKETGFRYRRLKYYLYFNKSLNLSENTIKTILKRNKISKRRVKTKKGNYRDLYPYEHLLPFTQFQLDTKYVKDQKALTTKGYENVDKSHLPLFEWNLIDIATRTRFTWYSYELNATYGFAFIVFTSLWIRSHNARNDITIRVDNGSEFCAGSQKKLDNWNKKLSIFNVTLEPIDVGAKGQNAIVENSHRFDDEYFLIPYLENINSAKEFMKKAAGWQDAWNYNRNNFGKGMKGMTPKQKLKSYKSCINKNIMNFPTLLIEEILGKIQFIINLIFNQDHDIMGVQHVHTKCQLMKIL